jgi:hypothetical protein
MVKFKIEVFDLGFCCLGNGVLCYNRAKEVNKDYQKICHISDDGNIINWYVNRHFLPPITRQKVRSMAEAQKINKVS